MKELTFKTDDLEFIKDKFNRLFQKIVDLGIEDNKLKISEEQLNALTFDVVFELSSYEATTEDGQSLNKDGIRLEDIWIAA